MPHTAITNADVGENRRQIMIGRFLGVAGMALMFAGTAQADAPDAQTDASRTALAKKEAPAPAAHDAAKQASDTPQANAAEQELHPDARPVYLNGGHFGGD
jgi:hypothetical protein